MPSVTYTAGLAYYDGSWQTDETAQGCYSNYRRTGVLYFAGMNLKGKTINSVTLTVTSKSAGYNASKSAFFYRSSSQKINTSLTGQTHRSGSSIGSISGTFYNNTLTRSADFLKSAIAAGENTFCIYATDTLTSSWSTNYLKWSKVTMTVDYSEPEVTVTLPTAPTQITPQYGTLTYYYATKPTIAWSGATGGTKYVIERAVSNDYHLDTWNVIAETTSKSYTDSALTRSLGGYVRYRVKNVSDSGASGYIYTGNIRRMLPANAPTNFTASAEQNCVTLSWSGIAESFVSFRIEYSVNNGDFTLMCTTKGYSIKHDISDLPQGSSIVYRIRSEQSSVDSTDIITSPYTLSSQINKKGGIFLMKDSWTRGVLWHKHCDTAAQARKIFIKIQNKWRESI